MNNPMQLLMNMLKSGNQQGAINMLQGNPLFNQAQRMLQNGGDPQNIIMNVAKQKGIDINQLRQMANQFGIKL